MPFLKIVSPSQPGLGYIVFQRVLSGCRPHSRPGLFSNMKHKSTLVVHVQLVTWKLVAKTRFSDANLFASDCEKGVKSTFYMYVFSFPVIFLILETLY